MVRLDTELLGLQIVSKADASFLGEVDALIVDDLTLRIAGFLVDLGVYEAKVVAFEDAAAVGTDAIIVESAEAVAPISTRPALEGMARREITITDVKAVTLAGHGVGLIGDFFVDTTTGKITGLELIPSDPEVYPRETVFVPASCVHRLGPEIVVLKDDYEKHLVKEADSLPRLERPFDYGKTLNGMPTVPPGEGLPVSGDVGPQQQSPSTAGPVLEPEPVFVPQAEETQTAPSDRPEDAAKPPVERPEDEVPPVPKPESGEASAPGRGAASQPSGPAEKGSAAQPRHFLLGKRVLRRIEAPSGETIAERGDTVTLDMIRLAKSTDMLLILSLNVE
jgi:uncharacterized protein YrrD